MKLLGDVSQKDRDIAEQLIEYEDKIDTDDDLPNERKAQSCICLAHDWYQLGLEEEGDRLLLKANKFYPGYFNTVMIQHIEESKEFDKIVKSIAIELMCSFMDEEI